MDKTFSIDRFENDLAVLIADDGGCFCILRHKLPSDACEGDLVALRAGAWIALREQTETLRTELFLQQESLFDE